MSSPLTVTRISPAHLRKQGIAYWKQVLAGGLYTGLSPIASGTVGSAVAVLLYYIIPGFPNPLALLGASLGAFLIGIPLADQIEKAIGKDPSFVTLDEFAGQWLALASPLIFHPLWPVFAFFCFRAFDIAKVWPASHFDRQEGGLGIMADDMVAGMYANVSAHIIWYGIQFFLPVTEFMS